MLYNLLYCCVKFSSPDKLNPYLTIIAILELYTTKHYKIQHSTKCRRYLVFPPQ